MLQQILLSHHSKILLITSIVWLQNLIPSDFYMQEYFIKKIYVIIS